MRISIFTSNHTAFWRFIAVVIGIVILMSSPTLPVFVSFAIQPPEIDSFMYLLDFLACHRISFAE